MLGGGALVVTNPRGLSYAQYPKTIRDLEEMAEILKTPSNPDAMQVTEESGSPDLLQGYKAIRNRFISVYARDKLGNPAGGDRFIKRRNDIAHGGDAVFDAKLYQGIGGRADSEVFEKLYGFSPGEVLRISNLCYSQQFDQVLRPTF